MESQVFRGVKSLALWVKLMNLIETFSGILSRNITTIILDKKIDSVCKNVLKRAILPWFRPSFVVFSIQLESPDSEVSLDMKILVVGCIFMRLDANK